MEEHIIGASPIPFSNLRSWRATDGSSRGHTYVNYTSPAQNMVDPSLNDIGTPFNFQGTLDPSFNTMTQRYPYGHVVYNSSLHDLSHNNLAPVNLRSFFDSVPISPSFQQILNAVTIHPRFIDILDPINEVCPISQKPFEPNETVSRINYCNHVFCSAELSEWFNNNVRCPVCRHDIRILHSENHEMYFGDESKEELPDLIEPVSGEQVWD
jgi:hypothetical protein